MRDAFEELEKWKNQHKVKDDPSAVEFTWMRWVHIIYGKYNNRGWEIKLEGDGKFVHVIDIEGCVYINGDLSKSHTLNPHDLSELILAALDVWNAGMGATCNERCVSCIDDVAR